MSKKRLVKIGMVILFVAFITTVNYGGCGVNDVVVGSSSGNNMNMSLMQSAPSVTTNPATNITQTTATLNGKVVNPNGIATTVYFNYQPDGCQSGLLTTISQTTVRCICDTVEICDVISELSPNTTYSFRFIGTNINGTTYGNNLTFTTSN